MNTSDQATISKPGTLVLLLLVASFFSLTSLGNFRVIDVLILGSIAAIVVFFVSGRDYLRLPQTLFVPLAIMWCLFFFSSITAAVSVSESVLRAVVAVSISATGIFIIPTIFSRRSFLWYILSISFVLGVFSVFAIATPFESIGPIELLRRVPYNQFVIFGPAEYGPVPVGGLRNPNILAITLFPGILAGGHFFNERVAERSVRGMFLTGFATAVPTLVLILTRSRGALLALAAAIIMYVSVHYLSAVTVRVLCLCGIIGSVFLLVPTSLGPIPSLIETVSAPRALRWRHALDAIFQQPILGYGVGNSRIIIPELQTQPHNAYYMLGTWSGIGAAILYLYFFAQTLLLSVRKNVETTPAVFPAILTGYWVISLFESVTIFHLTIYSITLTITFGFVVSSLAPQKRVIVSKND